MIIKKIARSNSPKISKENSSEKTRHENPPENKIVKDEIYNNAKHDKTYSNITCH